MTHGTMVTVVMASTLNGSIALLTLLYSVIFVVIVSLLLLMNGRNIVTISIRMN